MAQVHASKSNAEAVCGTSSGSWPGYDDLTAAGLQGLKEEIDVVAAQIASADARLDYHEDRSLHTTLTLGAATAEMAAYSEEQVERTHEVLAGLEDYLGHLEVLGAGIEDGSNPEAARWFAGLTPEV